MNEQVKFSGMVVAFNEAHLIGQCLESLKFCDEIILIDLGSRDETVSIARKYGARILEHPWVPIGEQAKEFGIGHAKHDWVILVDPDERVSPSLVPQMMTAIETNAKLGIVYVPWVFYFLGEELKSTRWGFVKKIKGLAVHKNRVTFGTMVNSPYYLKPGYSEFRIPQDDGNVLIHQWVNNIWEMAGKHWKYIKMEGEAQYKKGRRPNLKDLVYEPLLQLKKNLLNMNGFHDGWRGIYLSFFLYWFLTMRELSLLIYTLKTKHK